MMLTLFCQTGYRDVEVDLPVQPSHSPPIDPIFRRFEFRAVPSSTRVSAVIRMHVHVLLHDERTMNSQAVAPQFTTLTGQASFF
jgi:hypothetical protein